MKNVFATVLLSIGFFAASAQTKVVEAARFSQETVKLGTIKQGTPSTATFTVTNISKKPLVIEKAIPGCGCTLADYTKTPILPGKTGTITATYNATTAGPFNKTVSVKFFEIEEVTTLTLSGEVKAEGVAAN